MGIIIIVSILGTPKTKLQIINSLQNITDKLGDEIWYCYPCGHSGACIEPMAKRLFIRTVFNVQQYHLHTFTPLLCYTQHHNHKLVL